MENIKESIIALEACINSPLTQEEDKEKCRIQIERYKKQLKDQELQAENEARVKSLIRESLEDKKLYVDVDINMARKMRKAVSDAMIPYRSKKLEHSFRIFVSNPYQQQIVADIYNEKRRRFNLDEADDEVVGVVKSASAKTIINEEKEISAIKSTIKLDKKNHSAKQVKRISEIKSKID